MGPDGYRLTTDRLVLRFVAEQDVEPLTAYRNDPAVADLQDWDVPYEAVSARRLVEAHAGRTDLEPGRGHQIAIERVGRLIGDLYVGLDEHGGVAEIGFTLVPEAQGQGYAHEAAAAVVDDLVDRLGVHRVFAQLSKDNLASARLLERLGMRFEAFAPQSYWWRGAWDDNVMFAMSGDGRRAWRSRPWGEVAQVRLVELTPDNVEAYLALEVPWTRARALGTVSEVLARGLVGERGNARGVEADGQAAGVSVGHQVVVDRWYECRGVEELVAGL